MQNAYPDAYIVKNIRVTIHHFLKNIHINIHYKINTHSLLPL